MENINELNEDGFRQEVLNADLPVLVDFYAPWCGPCKMIAPLLEQFAVEFQGRIKFVKVNVDHAPGLAGNYGISGVPTLAIFRDGQLADMMVGFRGTNAFRSWLDAAATKPAAVVNGGLP
jgi:thioredoxin 1